MAGFADGFNSGLNMMLSARRLALYEEEAEAKRKKQEAMDKPIEDISPGISTTLGTAEGTTLEQATAISNIQTQEAGRKRTAVQTEALQQTVDAFVDREADAASLRQLQIEDSQLTIDNKQIQNQQFQRTFDNAVDLENAVAAKDAFYALKELAENSELRGTPTYDAMAQFTVNITRKGIEDGSVDILEVLSPEMAKATNNMKPLINGLRTGQITDTSEIVLGDYNESLNTLFNVKKNKYVGKTYIAEDGTRGEIVGVDLDFNTFEVEQGSERSGGKAILKGIFSYRGEDGEIRQSKPTFMPDASKAVIRETQRGGDAFAVSLNDMIDIAASTDSLIMSAMNMNPKIFEDAAILRDKYISKYERTTKDQLDINVAISDRINKNTLNTISQIEQYDLRKQFKYIGGDRPDVESESLAKIISVFPDIVKDLDVIQGGSKQAEDLGFTTDGTFYRMKRNKDGSLKKEITQAILDTNPKYEDIELNLKKGTPFEEKEVKIKNDFDFNGTIINKTISKEQYIPIIKESYKDRFSSDEIDSFVNQFEQSFKNDPRFEGRMLTDEALLDLLHSYFNR